MNELCNKVVQHLIDIDVFNDKLRETLSKMKIVLETYIEKYSEDPEVQLIEKALDNILKNPEPFHTKEEKALFQNDCWSVFNAIQIFSGSMIKHKSKKCKIIERKLFNVVFIPGDDYNTRILPVYHAHDEFLGTDKSISNFKSSTGSGKTRCAPFFFAIKAIQDKMEHPFFIMTQPSCSIIRDKIADFTEILGDSVICITKFQELESMYDSFPNKPVIALFTPHTLVKILARARERNFNLVEYSRFVLDEIHERSVDTDVLVALLAKKMIKISFPLQLLMMSATPDPRILKSFKEVQLIELPDTQLFHIEDIKKESPDFKQLDSIVRDSTIDIINKMVDRNYNPGHILIFTSGNKRINNLMNMISCSFESQVSSGKKNAHLLKKFDNFLTSQELFYDHLEEVLSNYDDSDTSLFFLTIKYTGFVNKEAQEIGKNPIKDHPNVIKIIVATNSFESSITIDGLAAVIDSGICNTPNFDRTKGLTNLEEGPISTQSQTQRRGRVGRKRDGICVQITIKNHPPIELRPPAIETEDISSNILCLRKIKINLEDITNLPLPGVSAENMKCYMDELMKIGALDEKKKLTNIGSRLAAFSSLSPFVSSSILKVSDKYKDDTAITSIVGSLAFLVLSTGNIFIDAITDTFRRNFCEDSDIITLMSSLLELMSTKGNLRKRLSECGFHSLLKLKI